MPDLNPLNWPLPGQLCGAAWIALNLWAWAQMGWDKAAAIRGRRRLSERRLLAPAWLAGAPGIALGMLAFRHKTSKAGFRRGLWLRTAVPVVLGAAAVWVLRSSA